MDRSPWDAGSVVDGTSENRQWGTAALSEISGARNLNDIHGGMAGNRIRRLLVISAVLATLFTAIIGTINIRIAQPSNPPSSIRKAGGDDAVNPPSFRREPGTAATRIIPPPSGGG